MTRRSESMQAHRQKYVITSKRPLGRFCRIGWTLPAAAQQMRNNRRCVTTTKPARAGAIPIIHRPVKVLAVIRRIARALCDVEEPLR